jgi:hypothetical protein
VGGVTPSRALESTPIERTKSDEDIELLDVASSRVTTTPLEVAGFVDGVQASLCLTHVEHRPLYLSYVGAAALSRELAPLGLLEHLLLQSSEVDAPYLREMETGIELSVLPSSDPITLERDAVRAVGLLRDQLERRLVTTLLATTKAPLVLDGSLLGREFDTRLVGVVKTSAHQWLDDESVLYGLPQGWRSPRFSIARNSAHPRYSCYVQMVDKSAGPWNQGLVRLESFDPELLDPLAALALDERQGSGSGDRRWDRHLVTVRRTEDFLRSRRPTVFAR